MQADQPPVVAEVVLARVTAVALAAADRRVEGDRPALGAADCLVAEHDEIVPVVHSKRLYEAWRGPKRWVELPGAGHNSTDGVPQFWRAIRGFLDKKNDERPA